MRGGQQNGGNQGIDDGCVLRFMLFCLVLTFLRLVWNIVLAAPEGGW